MNVKRSVETVKNHLTYAKEELDQAESYAKNIKDPELTKKVSEVKSQVLGIFDYIRTRTSGKIG